MDALMTQRLGAQEVFGQLDKDGDGYLSKPEVAGLKELVENLVEEKKRLQDPDKMVTYAKFEAMFEPGGECTSRRRLPPWWLWFL